MLIHLDQNGIVILTNFQENILSFEDVEDPIDSIAPKKLYYAEETFNACRDN